MKNLRLSPTAGLSLALLSSACALVMIAMTAWAGAVTPGYSHAAQFISELGATGARTEMPMRLAGFLPAGLLLLAFCWVLFNRLPTSRNLALALAGLAIYAIGYLAAAAFPCDPGCRPAEPSVSQIVHNIVGLAGYFLAPAFLWVFARATRDWWDRSWVATAGYAASIVALVALITLSPDSPLVGLSQRVLEFAVLGWVTLLSVCLARHSAITK